MGIGLYCRERPVGTVELRGDGARVEVRAAMPDPGDGLYRAVLVGGRGELLIGVMEPRGGCAEACRRLYRRDVDALGPLCRGEARCSRTFREHCWHPAQPGLLGEPFWDERLATWQEVWWSRREGRLLVAVALEEDGPFPLENLFCLARMAQVCGRRCAVYAFDDGGQPLPP